MKLRGSRPVATPSTGAPPTTNLRRPTSEPEAPGVAQPNRLEGTGAVGVASGGSGSVGSGSVGSGSVGTGGSGAAAGGEDDWRSAWAQDWPEEQWEHAETGSDADATQSLAADDWDDDPYGGRESRGRRYARESMPRPPRRGRGLLTVLFVLVVLTGASLIGLRWVQRQIDPPGPAGEAVQIDVPKGTSTVSISKLLEQKKVITNATVFRYYAQVKGKGGFQAGTYRLPVNDKFDDVLAILAKGPIPPDTHKLTVPEGFRLTQIADRVATLPGRSAAKFLEAAKSGLVRSIFGPTGSSNLEGLLFPSTYTIEDTDDETAILRKMVETFDHTATDAGAADAATGAGVSPYEALIVASLIEREAKLPQDRGPIARVIYNRLAKGQPLQIDATIVYALGGTVDRVLAKDLHVASPYNTYDNKGLPPTPIASPGRASIDAALHPTPGDWLYYVVTGADGSHSFATSYAEHRRNIALAKARGLR